MNQVDPRELAKVIAKGKKVVKIWYVCGFLIVRETNQQRAELKPEFGGPA